MTGLHAWSPLDARTTSLPGPRFKVPEAVYHRLLREVAASGTSLSEVARAVVVEAFASRDAIADLFSLTPGEGERPARGPLPLLELEQRLRERLTAQDDESAAQSGQLRRLEAMIDRSYFGLMLHSSEVPTDIRTARNASAEARHRAWVAAVAERVDK